MSSPFPFDLFISYAHRDNEGAAAGRVAAFVESLRADFAESNSDRPLELFFDQQAIRDLDDWKRRVLTGLQQSAVLVAFVSPAYFASEWCRREWETFLDYESQRTYPGEAVAPIYIVSDDQFETDESLIADDWRKQLKQRQFLDARTWWASETVALQQRDTLERLASWRQRVRERVRKIRVYRDQPWNLPALGPQFVGRERELAELHRLLTVKQTAGLSAVNGLGGIGKTTLAYRYCHRYRDEYPGGILSVACEGVTTESQLRDRLVDLALGHLFDASQSRERAELEMLRREDAERAFLQAKLRFENRGPTLLVFDNVPEADWLNKSVRDRVLPSPQHVKVLVTTRLGQRDLGGIECLPLDLLPLADAVQLLRRWRPFVVEPGETPGSRTIDEDSLRADDPEWKSAVAIVERVGRLTIAVEVIAIYLSFHPEIKLFDYLQGLRRKGIGRKLDDAGSATEVQRLAVNSTTMMEQLFAPTLDALGVDTLETRALEFAALMPKDAVPLVWLDQLAESDPALAAQRKHDPDDADPWLNALSRLSAWRLLTPVANVRANSDSSPAALGRIHQVVQEVVKARLRSSGMYDERERQLTNLVSSRIVRISDQGFIEPSDSDEVEWTVELLRPRLANASETVARIASGSCGPLQKLGRLNSSREHADAARSVFQSLADADPRNAQAQRDLSISFNKLGDVSIEQGDLASARRYFEDGLALSQRLADANPRNTQAQRDLWVSLIKLGNVSIQQGGLVSARRFFEDGFALSRRLADVDPRNAQAQRDLSVSLIKLGEVSILQGDLASARRFFADGLALSQLLAAADPRDAQAQRDCSISFNKLGDVSVQQGDLASARHFFEEGLALSQRLADADTRNAQAQLDLSISFNKLGDVSVQQGDLASARRFFEDGLVLSQRLADADPRNAQVQRELSVSFTKLGEVSVQQGDLASAHRFFENGLAIRQCLANADPCNIQAQRDLWVSFVKLGEISVHQGDLVSARRYFEDGLALSQRLAEVDPRNAQAKRDLSVSFIKLGEVSVQQADLASARRFFEDGLALSQQLADDDPRSAQAQRDLSILFNQLGFVSVQQGGLASARRFFEHGLALSQRLADADPRNAQAQRDLSVSFERLGELSVQQGDLASARRFFEEGLALSQRLADADPRNAQAQRDLCVSFWKLAYVLEKDGRQADANAHWRKAHDILAAMQQRGLHLSPQDLDVLAQLKANISA